MPEAEKAFGGQVLNYQFLIYKLTGSRAAKPMPMPRAFRSHLQLSIHLPQKWVFRVSPLICDSVSGDW
jgi:hypothetical protein